MSTNFNRRKFLKTSLYSLGSLALLSFPSKIKAASPQQVSPSNSGADAHLLYKQAKEFFYKKEYTASAQLYEQLLAAYPERLVYYDGYARVLGAQQKSLAATELFRQGMLSNPSNPHFKHRFALRLRNLCTGNHKAELEFINKYGQDNLMNLSAALMLEVAAVKPVKGYLMDLRDYPAIVGRINENLRKKQKTEINLESSTAEQIAGVSAAVEQMWDETRKSRRPLVKNVDEEVTKINGKGRRNLYFEVEKKSRGNGVKKAKKERWKKALLENMKTGNTSQVDKYAANILTDSINDTDTVGRTRKYFKKNENFDRLILLNKNLYAANPTYGNALASASVLIRYGNPGADLKEAKRLLAVVKPYAVTLPAVNAASYFLASAKASMKENQPGPARKTLLEGMELFDGRGGLSYSMMELYALTYLNTNPEKGAAIMNALAGKGLKDINPPIKNYLSVQLDTGGKEQSTEEKIKILIALSKLQKKSGNNGYHQTISEINALKSTLV